MTENPHTLFSENLAAYALGALEADEIRTLEEHLQTCAECRTELAAYQSVTEGLLTALPPQAPPAALKRQLAARLPQAEKPTRKRQAWFFEWFSFGQMATAAAFILLLGLNLLSNLQIRELQRQQAELAQRLSTDQSAIAMLAYPGTEVFPASEGVAGSLLMDADANVAVLFTWDLPEPPEGKTYQIWLIDAQGNRVSGGLFIPQPGEAYTSARIASPSPLSGYVGLGITIEPWGGSSSPTGPNVLKVNF